MRTVWGPVLVLFAAAGCATTGNAPTNQSSDSSSFGATFDPATYDPASDPFPSRTQDTSPKLILPAGGGPPVMAIPLGGNVYLPLNADPVTVGIPLSP